MTKADWYLVSHPANWMTIAAESASGIQASILSFFTIWGLKWFRFGTFASDPSKQPLLTVCLHFPYTRNVDAQCYLQNLPSKILKKLRKYFTFLWVKPVMVLLDNILSMDKWSKNNNSSFYISQVLLRLYSERHVEYGTLCWSWQMSE